MGEGGWEAGFGGGHFGWGVGVGGLAGGVCWYVGHFGVGGRRGSMGFEEGWFQRE